MSTYNQFYINAFDTKIYNNILKNPATLEKMKQSYLKRNEKELIGENILFKESLDHYVLKCCTDDPNYINTEEFNNYINYIVDLAKSNKLETSSNIVFCSGEISKLIVSKLSQVDFEKLKNDRLQNKETIDIIAGKLEKEPNNITQSEIDLLADYLYFRKNYESQRYADIYKKYIHFFLNDAKNNKNIKCSNVMLNAYALYVKDFYIRTQKVVSDRDKQSWFSSVRPIACSYPEGKDYDIRNDSTQKQFSVGRSSGSFFYIDQRLFNNLDFSSEKGFDVARVQKGIADIPFLTLLISHELTHNLQNVHTGLPKFDTSGFSTIVKRVTIAHYYKIHDAYYMEMEADKIGWTNVEELYKSENVKYPERMVTLHKRAIDQRIKFTMKKKENENEEPQLGSEFIYECLCDELEKNPVLIVDYPMLTSFFDANGNITFDYLANNQNVIEPQIKELYSYVIKKRNGFEKVKQAIDQHKYSEAQISNLFVNLCSFVLESDRKFEATDYALSKYLGETRTNFEVDKKEELYNKWFIENIHSTIWVSHLLDKYSKNDEIKRGFASNTVNELMSYINNYPNCLYDQNVITILGYLNNYNFPTLITIKESLGAKLAEKGIAINYPSFTSGESTSSRR